MRLKLTENNWDNSHFEVPSKEDCLDLIKSDPLEWNKIKSKGKGITDTPNKELP